MDSKDVPHDDDAPVKQETWRDFLYNSGKGTVLGRTGISWLKIGVFYVIFYCCLTGWFVGLLHAFYSTLDDVAPAHFGLNSLLQDNPAMGVRPMPVHDSTMIRFAQGKKSSYSPFVDHLEAFFDWYQPVEGNDDCNTTITASVGCNVDVQNYLAALGVTRNEDYGYYAGTPIVALKMNKVELLEKYLGYFSIVLGGVIREIPKLYGFEPDTFNSVEEIKTVLFDKEILNEDKLAFAKGYVGVSCDGQNAVDKQNIRKVEFYPKEGLNANFFPYWNQKGYRSPLLIVKFADVTKRTTIQVNCRLWAKNIDNTDGKEKRGSVHFEIYIN